MTLFWAIGAALAVVALALAAAAVAVRAQGWRLSRERNQYRHLPRPAARARRGPRRRHAGRRGLRRARASSWNRACSRTWSPKPRPAVARAAGSWSRWRWRSRCCAAALYFAVGNPALDRYAGAEPGTQIEAWSSAWPRTCARTPTTPRLEAARPLLRIDGTFSRGGRRLRQGGGARPARCPAPRRPGRGARHGARPQPRRRAGKAARARARDRAAQPEGAGARRHGRIRAPRLSAPRSALGAHGAAGPGGVRGRALDPGERRRGQGADLAASRLQGTVSLIAENEGPRCRPTTPSSSSRARSRARRCRSRCCASRCATCRSPSRSTTTWRWRRR